MSDESNLLALIRLYDQLLQRVEVLEEQVAQMGDEDEPTRYMDGKPIR